ncbi:MAG: hypothetical protein RL000_866, partial [Bacteroidota bacterium]
MSDMQLSISRFAIFFVFLITSFEGISQDGMKFQDQYQVKIVKSTSHIKIDGILDEEGWLKADEAKDFHMKWPNDIGRPTRNTFVKITYD